MRAPVAPPWIVSVGNWAAQITDLALLNELESTRARVLKHALDFFSADRSALGLGPRPQIPWISSNGVDRHQQAGSMERLELPFVGPTWGPLVQFLDELGDRQDGPLREDKWLVEES